VHQPERHIDGWDTLQPTHKGVFCISLNKHASYIVLFLDLIQRSKRVDFIHAKGGYLSLGLTFLCILNNYKKNIDVHHIFILLDAKF
jgi:hypothetical protein